MSPRQNEITPVGPQNAVHTITEYCVVITFRYRGWLYTIVGDANGDDFFIDHLTGRHIAFGEPMFEELTDEFNRRELWDVG